MDALTFRTDFPAFADSTAYPDSQINFWIRFAGKQLNSTLFGDMIDEATELFVAHNISLEVMSQKDARFGGQPGGSKGAISGKSVDKVSINYDTAIVAEEGAGHWNLTTYGTRLKRLIDLVGAGGMQIGGCGFVITGTGFWSP